MIDEGHWSLVGASRMQTLDRYTIEKLGVPGEILMESAGRAIVDVLLARWADLLAGPPPGEVCVVCGVGNNGGDGFVVARHLALLGRSVRIALVGDARRLAADARANYERAQALGLPVVGEDWCPPTRGVLVDAILGTGLTRDVTGAAADAIERINRARGVGVGVLSVDLPSGLEAETGQVLGCGVRADVTVTISLPKLALALEPGRGLAGEVVVARIGIVDEMPGEIRAEGFEAAQLWSAQGAARALPPRPVAGHKGSFGHVLVVAGSEGKTGAAALTAQAAGRAGAGLVTIGCPSGLNDILEVKCTEAMTVALPQTDDRALAESALARVLELAGERDVVAMGPGVGQQHDTVALMRGLAEKIGRPLVIDADGLNAFGRDAGALRARPAATVLTPHPGEAARLLDSNASEINADRVGAARELARISGAVVLLKGAPSIAAEPTGRVIVNATGGPVLATGGTGDVLTGIVAAYLAQGLAPLEAAALAAHLHGAAADAIASQRGHSGLLAGELADALPAAAESLRRGVRRERGAAESRGAGRPTLLPFPGH